MKAKIVDDDIFEHYKNGKMILHGLSADLEIIPNSLYEQLDNKYNLKYHLFKKYPKGIYLEHDYGIVYIPKCLFEKNIYSLVIKDKFYDMPNLKDLTICFETLRIIYLKNMLKQGKKYFEDLYIDYDSFKDFEWSDVKNLITKTFKDLNINIFVCKRKGDNNEY